MSGAIRATARLRERVLAQAEEVRPPAVSAAWRVSPKVSVGWGMSYLVGAGVGARVRRRVQRRGVRWGASIWQGSGGVRPATVNGDRLRQNGATTAAVVAPQPWDDDVTTCYIR